MEIQSEKIGGMLLESIAGGLYDGNLNSIREYVQNSIDAQSKKIEVFFENGYENLIIRDDGTGMNIDELSAAFGLGYSTKSESENNIGWRGIGIWSGIPIAERIVFITKRKGCPKYRIQINCDLLRPQILKTKDIFTAIRDATSEIIQEPLGIGESIESSHYTIVRYESILADQRYFLKKDLVMNYLCKNIPAPFDDSLFGKSGEVNRWLEKNGITAPNFVVTFEGDVIRRAPFNNENYLNTVTYKKFYGKTGKLIAVGWLLNKKTVERRGRRSWPDYGIFFKKKGFTIGDERLIERIVGESYRLWQYGEIHVLSPEILENSQRDSFEYNGGIIHDFYDQIRDYAKQLDKLDRYRSEHNTSAPLKKFDTSRKKSEDNHDLLEKTVEEGLRKANSQKKAPDDPSLVSVLSEIDSGIQDDKSKLETILNSLNSSSDTGGTDTIRSPSSLIEGQNEFNATSQESGGIIDVGGNAPDNMSGKEYYKYMIANGHSEVKKVFSQFKISEVKELELNVTSSLKNALQKKMGITENSANGNSNEVIELSRIAFGWKDIHQMDGLNSVLSINPELKIIPNESGNKRYVPAKEFQRNMEFGIMIHVIHDLFTNFAKHKKHTQAFEWYEQLGEDDKYRILGQLAAALSIIHTIIDHCEKITVESS